MSVGENLKHVVSISLGSSTRDSSVRLRLGEWDVLIERIGTDGNLKKAAAMLEQWDGKADAIGLGGTDLYVYVGKKRYTLRESAALVANVRRTPVLDGSGLKGSLERMLIRKLAADGRIPVAGRKVLLVCALDRFGMAEALLDAGAELIMGDLIFGLNINCPIKSLRSLSLWGSLLAPIVTRLPVSWFYPTGKEQEQKLLRHPEYFWESDIIAGDFHYIKKFMPEKLEGKIIITNTVTAEDRQMLRDAGISTLVTTTPSLEGRSFGTNVMEAVLTALSGSREPLTGAQYLQLLENYRIESSIELFNTKEMS